MAGRSRFPSKILIFLSKLLIHLTTPPPRNSSSSSSSPYPSNHNNNHPSKIQKPISHLVRENHELLSNNNNDIVVFDLEGAMLRSTSLFPYFMLVALEAGGVLRSILLLLSYPLIWVLGENDMGLKIMVFLSLFGIKKETFRIGSSVLPKFLLEDVGFEGFEAVMSFQRKVGSSKMPRIMVENFLKEYLGVESVVAPEVKSLCGYFLGIFEEQDTNGFIIKTPLNDNLICITASTTTTSQNNYVDHHVFSHCKEAHMYRVSDAEKRKWHDLPKDKYLKPLIFHDGRLAFRPTPSSCVAMFMWLPFGFFIFLFRFILGEILPFKTSAPFLAFSGTRTTVSYSSTTSFHKKGMMYVCNHRTLVDPLYISYALDDANLSAVTYSLSRFNEIVAPIRTVRLKRDRDEDRRSMEKLLRKGNVVVCPEGTTCREPYLLRFSPLFAELTRDIVPVALDVKVSMFYGTTASGHKCLDPLFHFLNPNPWYTIRVLERLDQWVTCGESERSSIEVANHVQAEIAKALGFTCTNLTRKDKYMVLAGNEGVIKRRGNAKGDHDNTTSSQPHNLCMSHPSLLHTITTPPGQGLCNMASGGVAA